MPTNRVKIAPWQISNFDILWEMDNIICNTVTGPLSEVIVGTSKTINDVLFKNVPKINNHELIAIDGCCGQYQRISTLDSINY